MRTAYQAVAWIIAALVMVQAATHAWSSAGAAKFIEGGGTLDLSQTDGPLPFVEIWGIIIHTISGMYVIPALAVILVVVGYLSHVHGALGYALTVAGLVIMQVAFGMMAPSFTFLAFLHGLNALALFATVLLAANHVRTQGRTPVGQDTLRISRGRARRNRGRTVGSGDQPVASGV